MEPSIEQTHADWLRLQRDLGLALNTDLGFEETLRLCLETARVGSGMDSGGIYLADPDSGDLILHIHSGLSSPFIGITKRIARESPPAQAAYKGEPIYFENYPSTLQQDDPQLEEGLRAVAALPLRKDGRVIGCLNLASHSTHVVPDSVRTGLEAIAGQISHAVIRRQTEDALRESEDRYRKVSELTSDYAYGFRVEEDGSLVAEWVTGALVRITGYSLSELKEQGGWEALIHPEDMQTPQDQLTELMSGRSSVVEYRIITKDRNARWMRDYGRPEIADGRVTRVYGAVQDISEFRRLEEQVNQLRKMEAIGQLAGGIAHDFNNMLSPILGYADFILMELHEGQPFQEEIVAIRDAARRAADITRQLLTFSRKQVIERRAIDLNEEVGDMLNMLRRLLGEDIEIATSLDSEPVVVEANPAQIQQILMNLAVNARDAMPNGGRLTIQTCREDVHDEVVMTHSTTQKGAFGKLVVSDTGKGMDPATLQYIYEPFFTTKDRNRGTGMGLSTVYGILQQHNGFIKVASNPGEGTTFEVYLPIKEAPPESRRIKSEADSLTNRRGTILVVEDDRLVRNYVSDVLKRQGFTVLRAEDGEVAIEKATGHASDIDLLVSDVVMPRVNGAQVFDQLRKRLPRLRALFISGYADRIPAINGHIERGSKLLQKPFTVAQLLSAVDESLEE